MKNTNDSWLNDLRRERLQSSSRNPGAAALMSFFVMGMGQVYAGHIDRGIMLMGFHFSGFFAAYSLYSNGILYEALFPYLGAHFIVMLGYVVSVFFILLWIYNIKDAYYLSLFASFRDWFEVERVLLPMLKEQPGGLLTAFSTADELLVDNSADFVPEPVMSSESACASGHAVDSEKKDSAEPVSAPASVADAVDETEEADVLEFRVDRKTRAKKLEKRRKEEKSETAHVVSGRDFEAVSAYGNSRRLYAGLIAIFMLVGIWFNNRQVNNSTESSSGSTLFSVSAEIGEKPEPQLAATPATPATPEKTLPVADKVSAVTVPAMKEVAVKMPAKVVDTEPALDPEIETDVRPPMISPEEPPFMRGLELVRNGDLAEAAALFTADLKKADPSEDSWKVVLNTLYRTDNKVAYEVNLRRYLGKYSDDSAAWFNLGKLLYDRSELVQAAQSIAGGLKTDPDNVRGNFLLGSIYNDLKLHEDSAVFLTRAVNLEPLNIEFNRMLARSLAAAGKSQDAVKYYQRVSSLVPADKEARQAIAAARPEKTMAFRADDTDDNQVLVVMGKSESRLVEKNMETTPIQQVGKVLYENTDIGDEPEMTVVEAVASQPDSMIIPTASAALPVVEKSVVEEKSDEPADRFIVSVAQPEKVAVTAPRSSGLSELEAQPSTQANTQETEKNTMRDTVAVSESAVDLQEKPGRIEEFRQKGSYEFSRGNWEAALPHYLNILKEKKDAQTYDIVGLIFEKLSMSQDAFDAIEHAYRLGMRDSSTLAKLGRLAEINGNFAKGEYYLYHALQKMPHRVDLRIRYARCLVANGREAIALKELDKIIKVSGDSYAIRRRAELEIQKIKSRK